MHIMNIFVHKEKVKTGRNFAIIIQKLYIGDLYV